MIVVVGLGNPEKKYDNTYHNIGFRSVDYFANANNIQFTKKKYNALVGEGIINGNKVVVLKPLTYMNLSGTSVCQIVNQLKLPLEKLIVVYDDADIPCGTLRFRKQGSAGTHNGMRNIITMLGSTEFSRLRVGIGKNENMPIVDYVLSRVSAENNQLIEGIMPKVNEALKQFVISDGKVDNIDINRL